MTDPRLPRDAGKSSEQILAEALRARAGGTPGIPRGGASSRPLASRQPLTIVQLVLAAAIAGLVLGILAAVVSLA